MSYIEIVFIAVSLAMDCFAVSFSIGATQPAFKFRNTLVLGLFFGFFQALMPVIGWIGGEMLISKISHIDHWIAFGILFLIGGKMVLEAFRPQNRDETINVMKISTLLFLSVATSIDALAVGFSFAMVNIAHIGITILLIGAASFLFSVLGVYGGKKLCHVIKPAIAEVIGGVILIIIGTKILVEHILL